MLRLVDTILFALSRYRPWARERMVYRALVVLATDRALVGQQERSALRSERL